MADSTTPVPSTDHDPKPHLTDSNFNDSATALSQLTDQAATTSSAPGSHIHGPAPATTSHAWLSRFVEPSVLQGLEARFHYGNYVLDRATGAKTFEAMSIYVRVGMHLLYYGSNQASMLHWDKTVALLKAESEKMGRLYDAPDSKDHIEPFIVEFDLRDGLSDLLEPDPSKYSTFNAFFGRAIRPDARPIAEPSDDTVTSSPADCRLTAFPTIDLATKYWIKGYGFSLGKLLGDDDLATRFDGGSIVIARLAPQDYHRWHAPVGGEVKMVREIDGAYYTVNPQAINEASTLDVFCENRRSVMLLERKATKAPVVVVAVGAMLVGSIKYVDGMDEIGTEVSRGQCLGGFYYGGSTVIVLYPKGEVELDADLVKNSTEKQCETYVRVGWRTGGKPQ